MKIWVPGTVTSKLQPQLALTIDRGLTVTVGPESFEWTVTHDDPTLPHDQSNLIVAVAQSVAPALMPHRLAVHSTLPCGQGLGSSLAATVAGVTLAETLGAQPLSLAARMDRVAFFEPNRHAIAVVLTGHNRTTALLHGPSDLQGAVYLPDQLVAPAVPTDLTATPPDLAALVGALHAHDSAWLRTHFPLSAQVSASYYPHAEMIARGVQATGGITCFASGNGPALICLAPATLRDFIPKLRDRLKAGRVTPLALSDRAVHIAR
ncbi:hypothetical protein [Lacticaseibacillus absianus]|uniref:hypothetical protein n=1 Tax=Lacticaseibacillus absianus TaxID=2729623 RepID=UPI0015C8AAD5|nr:hypothetical protein [Lacticaseibacillus absianus]